MHRHGRHDQRRARHRLREARRALARVRRRRSRRDGPRARRLRSARGCSIPTRSSRPAPPAAKCARRRRSRERRRSRRASSSRRTPPTPRRRWRACARDGAAVVAVGGVDAAVDRQRADAGATSRCTRRPARHSRLRPARHDGRHRGRHDARRDRARARRARAVRFRSTHRCPTRATVGGTLSAGWVGPRRAAYGRPRDLRHRLDGRARRRHAGAAPAEWSSRTSPATT